MTVVELETTYEQPQTAQKLLKRNTETKSRGHNKINNIEATTEGKVERKDGHKGWTSDDGSAGVDIPVTMSLALCACEMAY